MGRKMDAQGEFRDKTIQVEDIEHWTNELLTTTPPALIHELYPWFS